jgi:hypothetical protein
MILINFVILLFSPKINKYFKFLDNLLRNNYKAFQILCAKFC